MYSKNAPFRYDFVGSFLRPAPIKAARAAFAAGELDAAGLKEVEDRGDPQADLSPKSRRVSHHYRRRVPSQLLATWTLCGDCKDCRRSPWTTAIFSMGGDHPRLCAGGGQDQRRESPLCGAF